MTLILISVEFSAKYLLANTDILCEEKAGSLQCVFNTMAVCCSAVFLSDRLCERGRAAGSEEATHTLLERDDHLSPGDSQGLGYQSKGRKAQRNKGSEERSVREMI